MDITAVETESWGFPKKWGDFLITFILNFYSYMFFRKTDIAVKQYQFWWLTILYIKTNILFFLFKPNNG